MSKRKSSQPFSQAEIVPTASADDSIGIASSVRKTKGPENRDYRPRTTGIAVEGLFSKTGFGIL